MKAFNSKRVLCGDYQLPRQMLQEQTYDGHSSIYDDKMAADLGFSGAPIEGPTHFSQFSPLLYEFLAKPDLKTVVSVRII